MSALSDSGFEEDLHASGSELHECDDEEESCFIIQRHNEQQFLAHNCLARQPQITAEARSKLVSWLIAVRRQLKLSFESCCLAVNIMDRFLITTSVAADCFQLLGVTSLLIATKQVEVYSPRITQLLSLCCNSFSREQLCNLECLILLRLHFRLAAPTHAFFLDYFTSRTTGYQTDGAMDKMVTTQDRNAWKEPQKKWKWLACKVCELSLADYTFNKYMPSVIVLCAVKLAKDLLKTHSAQPTDNKAGSSKTLESFGFQEYATFEAQLLVQQCTEDLKLLVSLNQDAVQDFISPLY
ncbi:cyclin-O protein B-like [Sinocyclocheilus anshuiensis]|uniref:cyclin-O protein B-like n=1 Tax=Sinocyclocheilus anshuiensis TaxID=1608454 RepID=UPI0007BA1F2B|nr:PREDICTED: cyclin-O protein B-like [Sinocyclocheilus anshuiensis]